MPQGVASRVVVSGVTLVERPSGWSTESQSELAKYVRVIDTGDRLNLKSRGRHAGLVNVSSLSLYLPPPVPPPSFLGMVLIAHGLDRIVKGDDVLAPGRPVRSVADVLEFLAALTVIRAQQVAAGHIAQGYVTHEERLSVLRGRPLWHTAGVHPKDGRILCRFSEKTIDVRLNQAVLAGIVEAGKYLQSPDWRRRQKTQRFVWSSIAESRTLTRSGLLRARRDINRLTRAYEPLMDLIGVLAFGDDLTAPTGGAGSVPMPVFDMAYLFEHLVTRLVGLAVRDRMWKCKSQSSESRALTDATGDVYRRIRPDQLLLNATGQVVAVIDSKFKPQYASRGPTLDGTNRVTREDIYQMFFYAERLRRLEGRAEPLPSFVLAPLLPGRIPPGTRQRQILWSDTFEGQVNRLVVVPVNVIEAVTAVLRKDAAAARELLEDLLTEIDARTHDRPQENDGPAPGP